ncbi:hypothetical protein P3X46_019768 [Hevea brasiliensis]|uniref:ADP/ATP translocase n=1 Tax=Hevea brasiliensis TaxID=3981 RepID=A0ABQ9LJU6_HEVBR|nr:hypothetical protein P3X46_019768 [Hevea brasiliensis]
MSRDDVDPGEWRHSKPPTATTRSRPYMWLTKFQKDLMAGAFMGGEVHTIIAPIERAKLLIQNQESNPAIMGSGRRTFKGMIDCIVRTIREEGSLWKHTKKCTHQDVHFLSGASANFIAGAAAGCTTLTLIYPLDIAHTPHCIYPFLTIICKKDGIAEIYRGFSASARDARGFDTMKEILSAEAKIELALWKRWVVAQAVTTSSGLRMMMQAGLEQPMYRGTLDCWRKIHRTEGVASFYRGALSSMFRSTGAAAVLVLYDEVKKFMKWGGL